MIIVMQPTLATFFDIILHGDLEMALISGRADHAVFSCSVARDTELTTAMQCQFCTIGLNYLNCLAT